MDIIVCESTLSKNPTFSLIIAHKLKCMHLGFVMVLQLYSSACNLVNFVKYIFFLPHSSNIEFVIIPVIRIAMQIVFCHVKALHVFLFSVVDVHVNL